MNDQSRTGPTRRQALLSVPVVAAGLSALAACSDPFEDEAVIDESRDIDRDAPYLELASDADGPIVEVLVDFRCPPCKAFHEMHGGMFEQAVADESIVYRLRPRPMLDSRRGSTYSQDTAAAAAAVYAQDPGLLLAFETAMFAAQAPDGNSPDPDLEEIARIAEGIGADETAVHQIQERTYVDWTVGVVEPVLIGAGLGTPNVLINGELWEDDWTVPGELDEAIAAALPASEVGDVQW